MMKINNTLYLRKFISLAIYHPNQDLSEAEMVKSLSNKKKRYKNLKKQFNKIYKCFIQQKINIVYSCIFS